MKSLLCHRHPSPLPSPRSGEREPRPAVVKRRGALFALFAVCSLFFTGCARPEPRADLVILNGAEPESLDPAIITGQPEMRVVLSLFEGLARYDPHTGRAAPGLA